MCTRSSLRHSLKSACARPKEIRSESRSIRGWARPFPRTGCAPHAVLKYTAAQVDEAKRNRAKGGRPSGADTGGDGLRDAGEGAPGESVPASRYPGPGCANLSEPSSHPAEA